VVSNVRRWLAPATVLPTSVQFVLVTHAESDFVDRLERSDPAVIVGHAAHRPLLERLRAAVDVDHLVLTDRADYGPDPPSHPQADDVDWLPDILDGAGEPPPVTPVPGDLHTLLFTGGTTGRPKGCRLTHRNPVANVE
jgi:long-chain acyl-CoA synthetase